jgi:hypothetical protein
MKRPSRNLILKGVCIKLQGQRECMCGYGHPRSRGSGGLVYGGKMMMV